MVVPTNMSNSKTPNSEVARLQLEKDSLSSNQQKILGALQTTEKRFDGVASQLNSVIDRVANQNKIDIAVTDDAPDAQSLSENLTKVLQSEVLTVSDHDLSSLKELSDNILLIQGELGSYRDKWSDLNTKVTQYDKDLQELKQYIKLNNLLFHKFPRPNQKFSRISYIKWIAYTINGMLPMLEEPVSWYHIDAAHPLKTKKGTKDVIIVRFNHRVIRDTIFDNKRFLKKHNVSVTEHLTDANKELLDGAREILGFRNVWTHSCRVFSLVGSKKIPIISLTQLKDTMTDA